MTWMPLGERLTGRIRHLLGAGHVRPVKSATGQTTVAAVLGALKGEGGPSGGRPSLVFIEHPAEAAARSLKDRLALGIMEWEAAAPDEAHAVAALEGIEANLEVALSSCGVASSRDASGGRAQWVALSDYGQDRFVRCERCDYLSLIDLAEFARTSQTSGASEPLREVYTPDATTIKKLCAQLGIEPAQTLKALFLTTAEGETFLAVLRGDLEASPEKLRQVLGTRRLTAASPEAIAQLGLVPGFSGPVGLTARATRAGSGIWIVGDLSVAAAASLVTGANREEYHLAGVNYPRDFAVTEIVDFARPPAGAACARCGGALGEAKGFLLASRRTVSVALPSITHNEDTEPATAAVLEVFPGAVTGAVIAVAMWQDGMRFPIGCAAFVIHVIGLPGGLDLSPQIESLGARGLDVLVDDREVSAGVKFAEADWIGAPIRIVSGRKSADAGGVEITGPDGARLIVPVLGLVDHVLCTSGEVM
jgi:prolyl-tRNA synthetase